jgi:hypothetical protein
MTSAPHRHDDEEAGLACDFPEWKNHSRVSYSWDGLTWPRPFEVAPADSEESS